MNNNKSILQKGAILSISLMLTSSQAINGIIPQMKQSLGISQSQSELLGTVPSVTVIIFILLSSYFAKRVGMKKNNNFRIIVSWCRWYPTSFYG